MSPDTTMQHALRKRNVHLLLSALILVTGIALMIGKIYADSEPGAIPILLVVIGLAWLLAAMFRTRARG